MVENSRYFQLILRQFDYYNNSRGGICMVMNNSGIRSVSLLMLHDSITVITVDFFRYFQLILRQFDYCNKSIIDIDNAFISDKIMYSCKSANVPLIFYYS